MLKQKLIKTLMICAVAILTIHQMAYAQINEFKITAGDGAGGDQFGRSVSISGDYAIVGAANDDDDGNNSGSAYVFKRTGTSWTEEAKLTASDGAAYDLFGYSVSISGDYAIVGAYWDDDNGSASGSAYVFKRTGTSWTEEAKLTASDGAGGDQFGISVSISGDYAIVGAWFDDDDSTNSGSAYVFKRTGTSWTEEAKLTASDGAYDDRFGISVSISGDYTIIGAYQDDDNNETNSGSAYMFKRTGTNWTEEAKLTASDGAANDLFGYSVSIYGDYTIVGAYWDDDNESASGSAYVFTRAGTSWTEEAKLTASDGAGSDYFGISVSISGDYAIVGTKYGDGYENDSGSAYVFKRAGTNWTEETKLTVSDGAGSDCFGYSVSVFGDYAIVGAYQDDDNGNTSGSAYVYNDYTPSILIHVPADQPTIQGAIDIAFDGDTVLVQPGTYTENINFNGKSIMVISSDGAEVTTIDGNQSGSVVTFVSGEGQNSILEGFTITNGSGTVVDGSTYGGGIYCSGSSPNIIDCRIISNTVSAQGGGFYLSSSSPMIDNCTISGNVAATSGGIFCTSSSPIITNCTISGNTADYGGGISCYASSSAWIINTTFSGNSASIQGGALYCDGSSPIMVNSIMWADAAGTSGQEIYICCDSYLPISHSDIDPANITGLSFTSLSDNINSDPLFVSPLPAGTAPTTGGDYHLSANSPAINAGTAFYVSGSDTLVNLAAEEYNGSAPDLGAFESIDPPILSVLPLSLDFNDVLSGETATEPVVVKNIGDAGLNVSSIAISGVDSVNFSVDTTLFTITAGDSAVLDVTFAPDDTGSFSASLEIDSDGGSTGVVLAGNGIAFPVLSVTPNSIDFGIIPDGDTATEQVTIRNTGNTDLNVSSIAITGVDSVNFSVDTTSFTLTAGDTTVLDVTFAPDDAGSFSASLEIDSNGGSAGVALTGNAIAFPVLSVTPLSIDFGDVVVGETATEPVTVCNTGTAALTVWAIAITGDDPENFNVTPLPFTTIPFTLVPGDSQILEISITPDAVDSLSASLEIDSDVGSAGVALAGNGIAFPVLSVTPLSIDFGAIPDGDTATEQVTVTNTGTADLHVSSIAISGADSSNFDVDTTTFTLAPDDSQTLDVSFSPDQVSSFSASLQIASDSGSVSIDMGGVGVDPIPLIISITDVPEDQGRLVHLSWLPSGFDTLGEIAQYGIWEFNPEDEWVSLGNVPSIQADHYTFLATTYGDSTEDGIFWSSFMVTAHTTDPEVYYTSAVDSGYSVDNLAPAVPTGLLALITEENTVELSWDPPVDEDFNYFRIYRSLEPDFDPTGMEPFTETIETTFIDSAVEIGVTYYFILSAVDFNGNESEYSEAVDASVLSTGNELGIPKEFALWQNYPNPFNPVTTLRYDLPEQVHVTLVIYDLLGHEVKTLISRIEEPGYKSVIWDATNNVGHPLGAGLYLYQIKTKSYVKTSKMILLK